MKLNPVQFPQGVVRKAYCTNWHWFVPACSVLPTFWRVHLLWDATATPDDTPGGKHADLSHNPLCIEIYLVGHQRFCKVLFSLQLKFIVDLKADIPSHVPVPAYSCAARSVLPFKPCWRRCWRARAVCPYEAQTLLSYQNKARLAVSLSARGEGEKKTDKKREWKSTRLSFHF